jgi:hypothetical protein
VVPQHSPHGEVKVGLAHAGAHEGLHQFRNQHFATHAEGRGERQILQAVAAGEAVIFKPVVGHGAPQQADDLALFRDGISAVWMTLKLLHRVLHAKAGVERGDVFRHHIRRCGRACGFGDRIHRFLNFLRQVELLRGRFEQSIQRADALHERLEDAAVVSKRQMPSPISAPAGPMWHELSGCGPVFGPGSA